MIATFEFPVDQSIWGSLWDTLSGLEPLPGAPKLDVVLVPTSPILPRQLTPEDVVPPNISFEDY